MSYKRAYGIIETLAPLHVGATAGEETGNLNLIFRDQFTQTGIIPGSSIRGRLRAEMEVWANQTVADNWYGRAASREKDLQFESQIKMEHASIVWLPVFSPGQPIIWVSCPRLLRRYQRIAGDCVRVDEDRYLKDIEVPFAYTGSENLNRQQVFFNFGFVTIEETLQDLSHWFPLEKMLGYDKTKNLPAVIVDDKDIAAIHDMALYRQSRVALRDDQKVAANQAFFNVEAVPEGTLLVFPIAIKPSKPKKTDSQANQDTLETSDSTNDAGKNSNPWQPFKTGMEGNIYLGGLESVGFGHCYLTVRSDEQPNQ